jgi:hypothetical protein
MGLSHERRAGNLYLGDFRDHEPPAGTWGRFAKRVLDQIHWGEETFVPGTEPTWYGDWTQFNALCARSLEFNSLFVCVMAAFVVCAAAPLVAMAINCF